MGTFILSHNEAPRNGHTLADAFVSAFIPQNDNRILVKTTKQFYLRNYPVPAGTVGKIVDLVCDDQLFLIDFGLPIVARIEPGSELIAPVNLAEIVADLQADVNRFDASLGELERNLGELAQRWGVSDES